MRKPGQLFIVGISVFGLSGTAPVVAQDIYKWMDDAGLVNYADVVPPNVTAQLLDQRIFYNSQIDDGPNRARIKYSVVTEQDGFDLTRCRRPPWARRERSRQPVRRTASHTSRQTELPTNPPEPQEESG
jgi:hypothetical protein